MQRSGNSENPGLILYMNISASAKRRTITTSWDSSILMDYSENSNYHPKVSEDGEVTIEAPANSYAIWSITE